MSRSLSSASNRNFRARLPFFFVTLMTGSICCYLVITSYSIRFFFSFRLFFFKPDVETVMKGLEGEKKKKHSLKKTIQREKEEAIECGTLDDGPSPSCGSLAVWMGQPSNAATIATRKWNPFASSRKRMRGNTVEEIGRINGRIRWKFRVNYKPSKNSVTFLKEVSARGK